MALPEETAESRKLIDNSHKCWNCCCDIVKTDNYCRYCGFGQGENLKWVYKWWGIFLLFFCMGPFNTVYLQKSPVLSKRAKILWFIVYILITLAVIFIIFKIFRIFFSMLNVNFSDFKAYDTVL